MLICLLFISKGRICQNFGWFLKNLRLLKRHSEVIWPFGSLCCFPCLWFSRIRNRKHFGSLKQNTLAPLTETFLFGSWNIEICPYKYFKVQKLNTWRKFGLKTLLNCFILNTHRKWQKMEVSISTNQVLLSRNSLRGENLNFSTVLSRKIQNFRNFFWMIRTQPFSLLKLKSVSKKRLHLCYCIQ